MSNQQNKTTFSKSSSEDVLQVIMSSCYFVTDGVATMINEMALDHYHKVTRKTNRVREELHFNVFDVKKRYMEWIGLIKEVDGKRVYDPSVLPFTSERGSGKIGFSFNTIWNRAFKSKKTVTDITGNKVVIPVMDSRPFKKAGVTNTLVLDVKRGLNPYGIKVWDVSDSSKSHMMVWKITIYPFEDNWKATHGLMDANIVPFARNNLFDPAKKHVWAPFMKELSKRDAPKTPYQTNNKTVPKRPVKKFGKVGHVMMKPFNPDPVQKQEWLKVVTGESNATRNLSKEFEDASDATSPDVTTGTVHEDVVPENVTQDDATDDVTVTHDTVSPDENV